MRTMKFQSMILIWLITIVIYLGKPPLILSQDTLKIGVLSVIEGPAGYIVKNNAEAIKMAIRDFGGMWNGQPIELVFRDMHGQLSLAVEMARELYGQQQVDVIFDTPFSSIALAVSKEALAYKKLLFVTTAVTSQLVGNRCNPYTFKWGINSYALASNTAAWAANQIGKRVFTLTNDYAWGHRQLEDFLNILTPLGFMHVGNSMIPRGTTDFSQFLLEALKAKPDILLNITVARDHITSTQQITEFRLKEKGLVVAHGVFYDETIKENQMFFAGDYGTVPWYWKTHMNYPGAKRFITEWNERFKRPPSFLHAVSYSATMQYLKAVERANSKEAEKVIEALEGHSFRDILANPGKVYSGNHQQVNDVLIVKVKPPHLNEEPWDIYEVLETVPVSQAYRDPQNTGCRLERFYEY